MMAHLGALDIWSEKRMEQYDRLKYTGPSGLPIVVLVSLAAFTRDSY